MRIKWTFPLDGQRLVTNGIMSFLKGCSAFWLDPYIENAASTSRLTQQSENPAVYTRLSCFLPWVAEQYDMEYSQDGETDPACTNGQGYINEVTAEVCRTTPSDTGTEIIAGTGKL